MIGPDSTAKRSVTRRLTGKSKAIGQVASNKSDSPRGRRNRGQTRKRQPPFSLYPRSHSGV